MLQIRKIESHEINSLMMLKIKSMGVNNTSKSNKMDNRICSKVIMIKGIIKNFNENNDDKVKNLCANYGKIQSIKIPKPIQNITVSGVGHAFVEFTTKEGALFAKENLEKLEKLVITFHPEDMYRKEIFD